MEAYKRWVRRNKEYVHSLESLANGLTWLLPERFAESEIIPEAVTSILGIVTSVNEHIIETTPTNPAQMHTRPPEGSFFPYSLFLTLMKDVESLVEVMAQQLYGDDNKWNFIAVTEATKVLARLALLRNSGYRMLLQGGETINDEKTANQPPTHGRLLHQGRNGHFTPEGRALSAMSRFGENARMISDPTWFRRAEHHQRAIMPLPETDVKRPTLSSFLSEKGVPGGLLLFGEVMFIARPLVYVLLIRKYGSRSWLPWFVSLTIDLVGMSSSTILLTGQQDWKLCLSDPEKDELRRRKLLLALYLMRDPCFGKYTRQRLEGAEKTLEHVPIVGFLTAKLIELLVGAQTRYTYMSGS
ncbi:peroxisome biogenesis protein 16-like isoform X1 [Bidens hawaiensis]|uniref:peroxisome biogenesis protein 16-like isoform X1 n=2 Tax=Bidens hawaiensis TaxID=980011 RepID=UPI00404B29B7